jgi:predicted RNA-binding protein
MSVDWLNQLNYDITEGGKWSRRAIQFAKSLLGKTLRKEMIAEIKSYHQESTDLPNLAKQNSLNK